MSILIASTGAPDADLTIDQAIMLIREKSAHPLISAYVTGSRANGYAVPTSDLDLLLIFENSLSKEERSAIEDLVDIPHAFPIPVDPSVIGLPDLKRTGIIDMPKSCLHVWGRAVHSEIPNPPWEDYLYQGMHAAYLRMGRTRKLKPLRYPLSLPDDADTYGGYAWRTLETPDGEERSIKEIVVMTGWIATALVERRARRYVPTKAHCAPLFQECIGGELAESFTKITYFCRDELHYRLPRGPEEETVFRALLPRVLDIENFFLLEYQDFLIEQLMTASNRTRVRTSLIRLGEIVYPNSKSIDALRNATLATEEEEELRSRSLQSLSAI